MQPGVGSAVADELAGRSVFDDAARVEDEYAIGDFYGGETVGDDDGGAVGEESSERVLYEAFGGYVER